MAQGKSAYQQRRKVDHWLKKKFGHKRGVHEPVKETSQLVPAEPVHQTNETIDHEKKRDMPHLKKIEETHLPPDKAKTKKHEKHGKHSKGRKKK